MYVGPGMEFPSSLLPIISEDGGAGLSVAKEIAVECNDVVAIAEN